MFEQNDFSPSGKDNAVDGNLADSIGSILLDSIRPTQSDSKPSNFVGNLISGVLEVPPSMEPPANRKVSPSDLEDLKNFFDLDKPKEKSVIGRIIEDAVATEKFKREWGTSADSLKLSNGPLGPVIKELGDQLASGKLDPEKLKQVMKDVKTPADGHRVMRTLLNRFSDDLKEQFGMEVQFDFEQNGANMVLDKINVSEVNQKSGEVSHCLEIDKTGKPSAHGKFFRDGHGALRLTPDAVMDRFKEMMRSANQPKEFRRPFFIEDYLLNSSK